MNNPYLDAYRKGYEDCLRAVAAGEQRVLVIPATCPTCHAPIDSAEHHAECVAPLDQIEGGA